MKKLLLIFGLLFLLGCQPIASPPSGNIIIGITDNHLGNIQNLFIKVDSIILHKSDNRKVFLPVNKEYDLINLNIQSIIGEIGNITVSEGNYIFVTLNIKSITIIRNGITENVILPSNTLKIPINSIVQKDKTNAIILDFQAEDSLHMTGNGKIIMTPVIKLTEKEDVEIKKGSKGIEFSKSISEKTKIIATDIKGSISENKRVTKEDIDKIVIDDVGKIKEKLQRNK